MNKSHTLSSQRKLGSSANGETSWMPACAGMTSSGFTLIEVLIAIAIFAIMATMATVALQRVFSHKAILSDHIQQTNQLQMAVTMLRLDISQMIDRPVRNKTGALDLAVVGNENQITFTRTGNINPLGYFTVSHLQRISYTGNNALNRTSWDVLDSAPHTNPSNRTLLKGVSGWKITYLDQQLKRHTTWPLPKNNADNAKKETQTLPTAIEIVFHYKSRGAVTLLIPIFADSFHPTKKQEDDNAE